MRYRPLHCWECGTRVISGDQGAYGFLPNFRQVRFGLADGSYCESPFCVECAEQPWDLVRAKAFEAAVNAVDARHQITVTSVGGYQVPVGRILAVLESEQAVQANRRG